MFSLKIYFGGRMLIGMQLRITVLASAIFVAWGGESLWKTMNRGETETFKEGLHVQAILL